MKYGRKSKKDVKKELISKKYADENLVVFGQLKNKKDISAGGTLGSNSKYYTISKAGDEMLFIPYSKSGIYYKNMYVLAKSKMENLEIHGFWKWTTLKLISVDGHEKFYHITSGRKALKKIVALFGF